MRKTYMGKIFFVTLLSLSLLLVGSGSKVVAQINLPRLDIEIKEPYFSKLKRKQEESLQNKAVIVSSEDYVPAIISVDGKRLNVNISLKEVKLDNLADPKKWPLHIMLLNNQTHWGRSHFSIRNPKDKGFVKEFLFNETIKSEGLLSLNYKTKRVTLNGKELGGMAIELKLRQSSLVDFQKNMSPVISSMKMQMYAGKRMGKGMGMESGNKKFDQSYREVFDVLMENKHQGKGLFSMMDLDKWVKLYAYRLLFGIDHSHENLPYLKFHLNLKSKLIEPISYESMHIPPFIFLHPSETLKDSDIDEPYRRYVSELERVSKKSYINQLISEFPKMIYLPEDFLDTVEVESVKKELRVNGAMSRIKMSPVKYLSAYFNGVEGQTLNLSIRYINQKFTLLLESVSFDEIKILPFGGKGIVVYPLGGTETILKNYRFAIPEKLKWSEKFKENLTINFRFLGHSNLVQRRVVPHSLTYDRVFEETEIIKQPNFEKFDFLKIDEARKLINIPPGKRVIDKTLVVPEGYKLIAREGVELDMTREAMIISYSPIDFQGSVDRPILIHSSDSSGQGLAVLKANKLSRLKFVNFENLASPRHAGWSLTGAVTFYETEMMILHCKFLDNKAEDGLNIVRSKFQVANTMFKGNKSDALDSDFSEGKLSTLLFEKNGNDALDISGGKVDMKNITVYMSGDKALSVGEKSRVKVVNMDIDSVPIGIASKDISSVVARNIKIRNSIIGLVAYQKKSEFGPAELAVTNIVLDNVVLPYNSEKNSQIMIDRKIMGASKIKTNTLLLKLEQWAGEHFQQ